MSISIHEEYELGVSVGCLFIPFSNQMLLLFQRDDRIQEFTWGIHHLGQVLLHLNYFRGGRERYCLELAASVWGMMGGCGEFPVSWVSLR